MEAEPKQQPAHTFHKIILEDYDRSDDHDLALQHVKRVILQNPKVGPFYELSGQYQQYDRFVRCLESYTIRRTEAANVDKHFIIYSVPVYKGCLEDSGKDDGDDLSIPGRLDDTFVRIVAEGYPDRLMRLLDLKVRLEGTKDVLKTYYAQDQKVGAEVPLWDEEGNLAENLLAANFPTFGSVMFNHPRRSAMRFPEQISKWGEVAQAATNTSSSGRSYDPGARFFDVTDKLLRDAEYSEGTKLKLRFEILVEGITDDEFRNEVIMNALRKVTGWDKNGGSRIWDCKPFKRDENPEVFERDKKKSGYFLISSHLLGFYRTYADSATLAILRKIGQRQVPRQFPTIKQAQAAHELLGSSDGALLEGSGGTPGVQHTETNLSTTKSSDARGRSRKPNQAKAVGGNKAVSATAFAETFCWDKDQGNNKGQAEWLHRSAFSFGGFHPGGGADYEGVDDVNSSQVRKNLIFGTKEANTFMMRPEYTIKRIVDREHSRRTDDSGEFGRISVPGDRTGRQVRGTVTTSFELPTFVAEDNQSVTLDDLKPNVVKGQITTGPYAAPTDMELELKAEGEAETIAMEKPENWIKANNYFWLAPRLQYEFYQNLSIFNRASNIKISISPFARVIPLKLETEMDKLIEDKVYNMPLTNRPRKRSVSDHNLLSGFSDKDPTWREEQPLSNGGWAHGARTTRDRNL